MELSEIKTCKCVFAGAENVGKTSIVTRIMKDVFEECTYSTIGMCYISKSVKTCKHNDDKRCTDKCNTLLELWDTAGQERFANMMPMYYRSASFVLLVFSWEDFEYSWGRTLEIYDELKKINECNIILIGTKYDLINTNFAIDLNTVQKFATKEYNIIKFLIVSSKTNFNIKEIVKTIQESIINKTTEIITFKPGIKEPGKKTLCC